MFCIPTSEENTQINSFLSIYNEEKGPKVIVKGDKLQKKKKPAIIKWIRFVFQLRASFFFWLQSAWDWLETDNVSRLLGRSTR